MKTVPPKPSALILLPEAPYPTRGGGALRSACMVDYLARHFHLEAVNFRLQGRPDPAERFPAGLLAGSLAIDLPHHSKDFASRAWRNAGRAWRGVPPLMERFGGRQTELERYLTGRHFDEIWLEHFWMAPYAPLLRQHGRRLVLDLHNIESRLFESLASGEGPVMRALLRHFAAASTRMERQWLPQFDQVLVASVDDAERAAALGAARVTVVPNAIPWHSLPVGERSKSLVFSGNFEYQPNQQGLRWFIGQCWPQILAAVPDLRLRLVGVGIEYAARHTAGAANVDLVGPVEDAIEELGRSLVAIVPLLAGSGTRLKILEAWAAGTAVVSTAIGAEGLEANPEEVVKIASDPGSFTQSVIGLVQNEGERSRLATNARLLCERAYTWSSAHLRLANMSL
jgi:polysaccharide biosynthesis protein PslH